MTKNIIDKFVWWIPIKKYRNSFRNYLTHKYKDHIYYIMV
ncbi:hypothetical protein BRSU_2583 [Brachyspira suanatina]|uniref:Uncharacterized protein n=1 Tax=Brachyspira suanatina TaxID=381802 RepID=A0A0G4KAK5_9SPIR|nr:hypothetical protein BRSU_2583 [Brachyspira suanatina]